MITRKDLYWGLLCGVIAAFVAACIGNETVLKGGVYATNLEECNRQAKTLCESIACENHYRLAAGRLPRDVPQHCIKVDSTLTVFVLVKDAGDQ